MKVIFGILTALLQQLKQIGQRLVQAFSSECLTSHMSDEGIELGINRPKFMIRMMRTRTQIAELNFGRVHQNAQAVEELTCQKLVAGWSIHARLSSPALFEHTFRIPKHHD